MVKATRRVKRVKRSKKQVHRARDRKTNRRHKTNRRRYTRRQRGGAIIKVCEKSGFDLLGNSKGISISYNDVTQNYTIGNESYKKLQTMPRYKDALDIVRESFPQVLKDDDPVVLDQPQFETFKKKYCSGFADIGGKQCESIKSFIPPAASAAPVAAASATDTDSRKILLNKQGVTFRGKLKSWSGNVCEIDVKMPPFTKYVFTKNVEDHSVSIKYVMSPSSKTFCALAKYQTEGSRVYDFKIDFSLFSPSVTLKLIATDRSDPWDITYEFDFVNDAIKRAHDECEEPYTGSYEFYQEKNPLIAILFFTKPPEVVYSPIVYQNHIKKLIISCANQLQDPNINKLFTKVEATTILAKLEEFKERLETSSDQDMNALKKLDEDVYKYVRLTFNTFLVQKTNKQSLASKMSQLSVSSAVSAP